jgi:thioesterase domain-containing protein
MTAIELEHYLHEHIPLSKAMQVSVIAVEAESVVLSAPLAPNINHRETVFGGSAAAVATLAAWALVHTRLSDCGHPSRLVIQRNTMTYDRPIAGAFTARSFIVDTEAWPAFIRLLARKGRARIAAATTLVFSGQTAAYFEGEFVALAHD